MNRLLALTSVLEAVTGLALIIAPSVVARLLLSGEVSGAGLVVGRVAGFALVSLGLACWPFREVGSRPTASLRAMLTYNLLVTCYLIFLGIGGQSVGALLWPAVAVHGVLTLFLARAWFKSEQIQVTKG